ncbi:MAG: hypothetical protein K8R37_10670 [Bacteroidales bacterium]|nr:hypothetical protein [Bacteroidales bacterium]
MKTTKTKTDLVKKMREIRDKFSQEIMNMTFEQEKEYIKNQLAELKLKKHGRQHAI